MFYPKNLINSNQYTTGDKFLLSTTGESYTGFYFSTSEGNYFTGKNPNDGENTQLIPKNVRLSNTYLNVGDPLYRGYLSTDSPEVKDLSKYEIPKSYHLIPKESDYAKGSIKRYFLNRANGTASNIKEIDKDTYRSISTNDGQYNSYLFIVVDLNWCLTGPLHTYDNNGIIVQGVVEKNKNAVDKAEQTIPGLSLFLSDLIQYRRP